MFAGVAAVNLGGKVDFLRFGNKGNLTDVLHIDFHRIVLRRRDRSEFGVFLLFRFTLFLVVVKIERFIFDILVRFLVVEVLGKDIVRRRFRLLLVGRQDRIGHRLGFRNHKIIIIVVAVLLFVRNGVLFRFFGFFRMFLLLGSGGFRLCRLLDRFFLFRFDFLCRSLFCRSFLRLGRRFRFFCGDFLYRGFFLFGGGFGFFFGRSLLCRSFWRFSDLLRGFGFFGNGLFGSFRLLPRLLFGSGNGGFRQFFFRR